VKIKMADLVELGIQFLIVAFGALAGSTFMWMVLGPIVAKRGMNAFMSEAYDLTDDELSDPKAMMKAINKKTAESMASSIYGALGNVMETVPTADLAKLAGQNPGLVQQFMGGGGAQNILGMLGMGQENGKAGRNPFAGIVQMMLAMQAMSAMGSGQGGTGGFSLGGGSSGGGFNPGLGR